ncbi:MAG: (d)CMP kinase [Deltaproteobacteria bacterium]|nr:(d)CMP kinase [Deltaproteobacteria bacterium]
MIDDSSRFSRIMSNQLIITIDGPTGSGKSTVSRLLAQRLHYRYLDTGAMYRAVGLAVQRAGVNLQNKEEISKICNGLDIKFIHEGDATKIYLGNEDVTKAIREPAIDLIASDVSALDNVRKVMTILQRKIGSQGPLVAEGRDMGTVVFPDAQHKFYINASLEVRVDRRFQERQKRGESISREKVKKDLIKRDNQDMNRHLSPLKPARDAKIIDTTNLSPHQIVGKIIKDMVTQVQSSDVNQTT